MVSFERSSTKLVIAQVRRLQNLGSKSAQVFCFFFSKLAPFLIRAAGNAMTALATTATLQTLAVLLICLLLVVSFVPLQQNADGLLLSIMALQKPTVYYWGADRFGSLTEFLTLWLRNPTANQYAQVLLELAAGLAAPVFFCSLVLRRAADAWRATALSSCFMLLVCKEYVLELIFAAPTPYGLSLTCAGLAALALRQGGTARSLLGAGLLIVAYITNFGLTAAALPIVGLLAILLPSPRSIRLLLLHSLAAVIGSLLPAILSPGSRTITLLQFSQPDFLHYASVIWYGIRRGFIAATLLPAAALLLYLLLSRRLAAFWLFLVLAGAMLTSAALYFCVLALSQWVMLNLFHIRYFIPGFLLLMSLSGVSVWLAIKLAFRHLEVRQTWFVGLTALLLLAAFHRLSEHPVNNADIVQVADRPLSRAIAARYEAHALDGIAASGESLGYWVVWPAVFMTEQYHYDAGYSGLNVIGITSRGEVRRDDFAARLGARGHVRIACIDLTVADCAALAAHQMSLPDLRGSEFAPAEPLPGNHRLTFADMTQAPYNGITPR